MQKKKIDFIFLFYLLFYNKYNTMKKIIKRWSDSNVISFTSEELEVYGIAVGDIIDIEICKNNKKDKKRGQK